MRLLKRPLRILAVTGKELVETLRRPRAVASVIAGPVLILGLFGLGYIGQPALRTVVLIPPGSGLPTDPSAYASTTTDRLAVVGVTSDLDAARQTLRHHEADLLVIAPADAMQRASRGEQAVLTVEYDSVSPYQAFVAGTAADALVSEVNRRIVEAGARQLVDQATAAGLPAPSGLNPQVVAAPTRADVVDLAPSAPSIVAFYGIMVVALIVQHTATTVSALSVLRDRRPGTIDLLRIAPLGSADILIGKYGAILLLGTAIALAVLGVLVGVFGVPFLASPALVVLCLALLVVASTGIGTVIATIADTDRQAVQLALLVLLASVFFSGLAVDVTQFSAPVQAGSELLPVTEAGRLLQDLLLRGQTPDPWRFVTLAAIAVTLFLVSWIVLRRLLHRPG